MKKMLFIMNPYAGKRRANKYLADILEMFNRADYLVTVHMTAGPGDATGVVQALAPGMDIVVCCGGDGTFNETVAGLLKANVDIPVGYIRRFHQRFCRQPPSAHRAAGSGSGDCGGRACFL